MLITPLVIGVAQPGQLASGASTMSKTGATAQRSSSHSVKTRVSAPAATIDLSEPSGQAPPSATAMPGYVQTYVSDFTGISVPTGWDVYSGIPGGDPGAQWGVRHVQVSGGVMQLSTWQDRAYGGKWVAGGLCQCGITQTYGAYFVRSKLTGAGPTQVELLWPKTGWPPEIDFNETNGGTTASQATVIYPTVDNQVHNQVAVDMTQWHTWGVIWTPTLITYTLDGNVWGQVDSSTGIPHQPMTLDIQQQTWCDATPSFACPSVQQSTLVDWVAEYQSVPPPSLMTTAIISTKSHTAASITLRPFAANSASLSSSLKRQVADLARRIRQLGDTRVVLTGYSDSSTSPSMPPAISRARAMAVEECLRLLLNRSYLGAVSMSISAAGSGQPLASDSTLSGRSRSRRVVANIN